MKMNRRDFSSVGVGAVLATSTSGLAAAQANPIPNSAGPQAGSAPGVNPFPSLTQDDPAHPGFVLTGIDNTPGRKAYYIHLEAKPGKGDQVQQFLRDILAGVEQEPLTGPWFGTRYSETTFGIFEAFPDADARHAHDTGPGGHNFLRSELLHEMLAYPAHVYRLDVLFGKFDVMFGKKNAAE